MYFLYRTSGLLLGGWLGLKYINYEFFHPAYNILIFLASLWGGLWVGCFIGFVLYDQWRD
jgi:hypothetical protein